MARKSNSHSAMIRQLPNDTGPLTLNFLPWPRWFSMNCLRNSSASARDRVSVPSPDRVSRSGRRRTRDEGDTVFRERRRPSSVAWGTSLPQGLT